MLVPSLAFWGRPAGRPVSAPLRERAAPPPGCSPARGPPLAAPLPAPAGSGPGLPTFPPSSLPLRLPVPAGSARLPCSLSPTSAACGARGPGWARRVRRRRSAVTTPPRGGGMGGDVDAPPWSGPPPLLRRGRVWGGGGHGGGRGPPGDDTAGWRRMGRRGDVVSLAQSTGCARCTFLPIVIIPAGINRWHWIKLLRRRTVSRPAWSRTHREC